MFHSITESGRSSTSLGYATRKDRSAHVEYLTSEGTATTTSRGSSQSIRTKTSSDDTHSNESEVLLLEGDNFAVSHDGIARTGYHLATPILQYQGSINKNNFYHDENGKNSSPPLLLAVEELYNIQSAHKEFVLRHHTTNIKDNKEQQLGIVDAILEKQAVGVAPLGESIGSLHIQEIDQGVFGSAGTGATTWEASIAMGLFFASNPQLLQGHVVELGCGVGFGSILSQTGAAALFGSSYGQDDTTHPHYSSPHSPFTTESVTLTDGNPEVLVQCRKNVHSAFRSTQQLLDHRNGCFLPSTSSLLPPFYVKKMKWELASLETDKYETVIACDVAYLHTHVKSLVQAMTDLLAEDGTIHIFGPYNRGALQKVCKMLQEDENFDVNLEFVDLQRYRLKPFSQNQQAQDDACSSNAYQSKSTVSFLHATAKRRNYDDPSESCPQKTIYDID